MNGCGGEAAARQLLEQGVEGGEEVAQLRRVPQLLHAQAEHAAAEEVAVVGVGQAGQAADEDSRGEEGASTPLSARQRRGVATS